MKEQTLFDVGSLPPLNGRTTNRSRDGVFGWYHYVQDFTGQFALDWLERLARKGDIVWDPFMGSGTTVVASKLLHLECHGFDISPFMVDVAKAKTNWNAPPEEIESALREISTRNLKSCEPKLPVMVRWEDRDDVPPRPDCPIPAKWIAPAVAKRFSRLLAAVNSIDNDNIRRFLRLATASVLIPASNMVCRPNISYRKRPHVDYPVVAAFEQRSRAMIRDYREVYGRPSISGVTVDIGDARCDGPGGADLVFTSPPYPNDMEYVHQTRMELALLDYVHNTGDLTDLKKRMISSSVKLVYRVNEWQKDHGLQIAGVNKVSSDIAATLEGKNWGWNAADMVAHYFGGMRTVLANWATRLNPGGRAAVVIGDSAFNGNRVPTDQLLTECATSEGFQIEGIKVFRKRWNNKHTVELQESVVLLRK